jgi:uncharacterized protein (TIGR03083 family)
MSGDERAEPDPVSELRFALAEADAVDAPDTLRARVLAAAIAARPAGHPVERPEVISGAEVFRRTVERLDGLLGSLGGDDWSRPTIRDLDVQRLVGHLIGVETSFVRAVTSGVDDLGTDGHVTGTTDAVRQQADRATTETHREWFEATTATIAAVAAIDPSTVVRFYGVELPLDAMLVVRAFEMWTHDEDVRRATGRPLPELDPERLHRMVSLVTVLLPAGMARASRSSAGALRLVLTGPGGGTWDVNVDGSQEIHERTARVIVDAGQFCRVVGNRADLANSGAIVVGDHDLAADLFVGASALALD